MRNLLKTMIRTAFLMAFCLCVGTAMAEKTAPYFMNQSERLPLPSLKALTRLRFVTTVDFPPFNHVNAQGQLSGYNIDLVKALCEQLNLSQICQIEAVPWNELEQHLRAGNAEAIIAGLMPTPDNREEFTFSRSYMRFPARFVTRIGQDFDQPASEATRGKAIGVVWDTAHEHLLKSYFPEAAATLYPDRETMLGDLMRGKLAAVFDDGAFLASWLDTPEGANCCTFTDGPYLAPQFLGQGMSIAVHNRNAALADAFNNALQALEKKGVMDELYLRHFPVSFY